MAKIIKPHLLVIGGTGFIGFHLILAAKKEDGAYQAYHLISPKLIDMLMGLITLDAI